MLPSSSVSRAAVDEGRVVEALRHSFAQIMRFRALTHMFDGWQVSLMLDDGQSKGPFGTIRWRTSTNEQARLAATACSGEFALR